MSNSIEYFLFDSRYMTDPNNSICYEVCDSLKEAKESSKSYDCVIVECTIENDTIIKNNVLEICF